MLVQKIRTAKMMRFTSNINDITRSELYTMRRTNLVNLPEGYLRASLMKTWAKHGTKR